MSATTIAIENITSRIRTLRRIPLLLCFLARTLLARDYGRDLRPVNADPHVGSHLQSHHVFRQGHHLTVNSAGGHHLVIFFELIEQLLVLLCFLLLWANDHEVHDTNYQIERAWCLHPLGPA